MTLYKLYCNYINLCRQRSLLQCSRHHSERHYTHNGLAKDTNNITSDNHFKEKWIAKLEAIGVPEPYWSVKWITEHVQKSLSITNTIKGEATLLDKQKAMANELLKMRSKRIPVQYIIGEWDFRNVTLTMRAPVFIPEPETEELVGHIVKFVDKQCNEQHHLKFLDLCCGSGAISIALLQECPNLEGYAVDLSEAAVQLTRENARRNSVGDRLEVTQSSLQTVLLHKKQRTPFDFIVSNPPYIPTQHILSIQTEVKDYIDHRALDGGTDGLQIAKDILSSCRHILKKNGQIWLEMGYNHGNAIQELVRRNPKWELTHEYCYLDFNNWPRFHQLKRTSQAPSSH